MAIDAKDAEELRYKGFLGHLVVVLADEYGSLECSDVPSALTYVTETVAEHSDANPRIYRRTRIGAPWRAVKSTC